MQVETSVIIFGVTTIVAVVGGHVRLSGKVDRVKDKTEETKRQAKENRERLNTMSENIAVIKSKVINGAFVRKEDCPVCTGEHGEKK